MSIRSALMGALTVATIAASPASAQKVGHYAGSTTDGNNIQFDVTQDSGTGAYSITGASIGFHATCRGTTGETLDTGWGFGLSEPIVSGKATLNEVNDYYNFQGAVFFTGNNMHGNVTSRSPKLSGSTTPPTQALFCLSTQKSFTGSLQPASNAAAKPAIIGNYVYDRKGRVIGVVNPH